MYEEHFGLSRQPFRITPDTSLFFDGGNRGDILGALVYAVHRGEGIIKVVGEVGSGKTMLCRMLQLELPDNVEIIYIANPSVSPEDILFVIADELKFDVPKDASKHELVSRLQQYLLERHSEDRQVVLFVEEAQGMPLETLEEIRLLSNLETDQHKLLQIILFGQPELDENLRNNSIRQLRERITHDFNLSPLTAEEIHKYLNFRMREVGYTGPELINKKLAKEMARHSAGLLRRINILADKMLLSAFADDTHNITSKHLMNAVKDSGFAELHPRQNRGLSIFMMSMIFILLVLIAIYLIYKEGFIDRIKGVAAVETPATEVQREERVAITQPQAKASDEDSALVVPDSTPSVQKEGIVETAQAMPQQPALEVAYTQDGAQTEPEPVSFTPVVQNQQPDQEISSAPAKLQDSSKKNQQSKVKLDKVTENQPLEVGTSSEKSQSVESWLNHRIQLSRNWLSEADPRGVSIQVMMRSKVAMKDLADYLRNEWPLDLDKTYIYEVKLKDRSIYRVFYDEYPSVSLGHLRIKQLPESVRVNSPYLHSIYRMQEELL